MDKKENLLQSAARAWKDISKYYYIFTYGYKGKVYDVRLFFPLNTFPHLAGFQYLNDVNIPRFSYAKIVDMILSGRIKYETIKKSCEYETSVRPRLEAIIRLKETLENDFCLYSYMPQYYPFTTKIIANYLISSCYNPADFVFIIKSNAKDESSICDYVCCSAFSQTDRDYRANQRARILLKKVRVDTDTLETTVFINRIDDTR